MPLLYSDLARSFDQREHRKIELRMQPDELEHELEKQTLINEGHDENSAETAARLQHSQLEEKIRRDLMQEIRAKVMQSTQEECERILNNARMQAEAEIQSARDEGYDAGHTEGFAQGMEKGRAQAFSEAQDECDEIRKEAHLIREQAKAVLEAANKKALSRADREYGEITDLAITIASRIINAEIDENKELVTKIAKEACREFKKRRNVILHVHPDNTELFEASVSAFSKICPNTEFVVLPDEAVELTGSVIECDSTVLDAQITPQLENVRQALQKVVGKITDDITGDEDE